MTPDRLFLNGRIYTVDPARPWAEAVAVAGGRIVAVGSNDEIRALGGAGTGTTDLGGRYAQPGFIDSHLHFSGGAEYLSIIGVRDARSMAEVLRRLGDYAARFPEREWLVGQEFSYGYPDLDGDFHHSIFDAVVPDRPVYFRSYMAHAAWANGRALELAGITRDTPDPPNGVIMRDASGAPTGWLKEHASNLIEAILPPRSAAEIEASLRAAMAEANRLGLTRVQCAGYDTPNHPILARLRDAGELTLRFTLSTVCDPPAMPVGFIATALAERGLYADDFLDARVVKFFLDGVLESYTAYMPQGYADRPEETGLVLWETGAYREAVRAAQENGFQVWTHAIGTGAITMALDAYAADAEASLRLRPRVEHVEIPTAEDIARFARIGAIASLQPTMVFPKDQWMGMPGLWEACVGEAAMTRGFPLRSILDAGGALALGTDWPVVELNPLVGVRNAVLRRSYDGEPAGGWVPAQRITLAEAIRAYTLGAAYAGHREADEGSITPGKLADIVVLSENPFEIDVDRLHEVAVAATILGGRFVHGGEGFAAG